MCISGYGCACVAVVVYDFLWLNMLGHGHKLHVFSCLGKYKFVFI